MYYVQLPKLGHGKTTQFRGGKRDETNFLQSITNIPVLFSASATNLDAEKMSLQFKYTSNF
jgi:hypothetical protein